MLRFLCAPSSWYGEFAFFSLARRKLYGMKMENCMHFIVAVVVMENLLKCCCLRWLRKFCGRNNAYDWRAWRLAGKLICILFKWIVWFLLLYKAATTLLNIFGTLLFYFLLNLFRSNDALVCCFHFHKCEYSALSTAVSYEATHSCITVSMGVACVNAKCRRGPQKVAPKPSRVELSQTAPGICKSHYKMIYGPQQQARNSNTKSFTYVHAGSINHSMKWAAQQRVFVISQGEIWCVRQGQRKRERVKEMLQSCELILIILLLQGESNWNWGHCKGIMTRAHKWIIRILIYSYYKIINFPNADY